ncbi:hypothetical protein J9B83_05240 [Marinomonas sp. A79]|uniref:Protein TusB n=1 Tax=Marinomonas vulgaris TaxID=2823372 RepID=A0ABS5H9I2_9GAMM|nr:DsrH/TusB family sulfur metabolism protein [Marinomonas vulgaris]MBR7888343.1 hypothetical protein [Marinomonas vulgaris]
MRLHQINQLDYPASVEANWQNSLQDGDHILFIEAGILRLVHQVNTVKALIDGKNIEVYYLQSDAVAYGLSPNIGTALSDEDWVNTTFNAEANISW